MSDIHQVQETPQPRRPKKARSIMWKVLVIGFLILALLIPLGMISGVITERQYTKQTVVDEISQTWAGQQTLLGPVLAVPYKVFVETKNDKGQKQVHTSRELAYILPQQYNLESALLPEVRYRSIYQSVVYTSDVMAEGSFDLKTIEELKIPLENILWNESFLVLGIPHTKGLSRRPDLTWQGKALELLPGVNGVSFARSGLYAPVSIRPETPHLPFKLNLSLKGSQSLAWVPIGKQNILKVHSDWASPSFIGNTLPSTRAVDDKGFKATWEIPYFARNYGQALTDSPELQARMMESVIGVELLTPVDSYRQSERAIKYGVLFLTLTFATFFLFEVVSRHRLHLFQYLLVGCAISLFYLLLIAFSEVIPFEAAYAIASVAIVAVITLYCKAILGRIRQHAQWLIGGLLTVLYGYLYILLQLEDLSLLFGAIGLFIVLAVMMYVTRNIDWYQTPEEQPA